jgi:hypothetical protein
MSISIKELRIGNWVDFNPGKGRKSRSRTVKQLLEETCIVDDSGLSLKLFYESDSINAIPLSPEILIACGFEKSRGYWSNPIVSIQYVPETDGNEILYLLSVRLKSLHQFQNLYWCLTGEELTYSPK